MIELEKTYLAKRLPLGLKKCKSKEIIDIYISKSSVHPTLRIRKSGNKYVITKKEPIKEGDASHQIEQTIILTKAEFDELTKLEGKKAHKVRYYYDHNGRIAEFDVFQGPLKGLIIVDFEFKTTKERDSFKMPEFCLADVTKEVFVAGGMICGKSYKDIEAGLKLFNYKKLFLD